MPACDPLARDPIPQLFRHDACTFDDNPSKVQRAETNLSLATPTSARPEHRRRPSKECPLHEPPEATLPELKFRHSFWHARRERIRQAMQDIGLSPKRRYAFDNCGADAIVMIEQKTGQLRLQAHHCHDRFCEACQQARGAIIRHNLEPLVARERTLHVVLTWASEDRPLKEQLRDLYAAASKLRQRPWWKKRVQGGSQTLELTRNAETGQWHPHLHILCHAGWIPLADLSREWLAVTGHSHRVHVSLVQQTAAACREVTKYLSKPIHRSIDFVPEAIAELMKALKGVRMITTFGNWRLTRLMAKPIEATKGEWRVWGTLHQLMKLAEQKDPWAFGALMYLSGHTTHPTAERGSSHDPAE